MKKTLALILSIVFVIGMLAGCGDKATTSSNGDTTQNGVPADFKVGFIFLHDENSTYDKNFMDAANAAAETCGLTKDQVLFKTGIAETDACYNAAAELVDEGCDVIFADSFGHESFLLQAAEEFTDVQFCHATGTQAKVKNLPNYHNAFASIYEGRFLAGVAAGMKLNEMIEKGEITKDQAKIGYVGAFDYAEVVSGMTSFYLGAKYICESVTMEVTFTNSWFDIALEKEAANSLIADKCVLISQHADSEGAPKACEAAGVPNVAYNISTISMAPNTALISSKINWQPYMELIIKNTINGEVIPVDYCPGIKEGSVVLTELNEKVAAKGTKEAIEDAKAKIISGDLKVFDTSRFTVKGKTLTEQLADIDGDYTPDTNVITDGYYHESELRSAPYFDIKYIDGITQK